eukprot:CAMPEP_0170519842 /NCGR_PEP_ID=MMETSP0209-20121228/5107_1 /TAXON_ID=665100 ORGANISM="Litonotus pictus, Strain P1" /NCGR_SAMPLE_ID=MMETSP0209 /ASSEMBLY_ACC=CAM_ASM_000301 /LENGTH=567 /DNA_ID=CAMNT_0010805823 /DNA_START=51 /DNA_END=1751 /DNA_ORIENTATION=+
MAIIFGLLIAGFGQDFLKRENPLLIQSTESPKEYSTFNLTNKNFSFAVKIEDVNGVTVNDPRLFYLQGYYYYSTKTEKGEWGDYIFESLDLQPCTKEMFFDNSQFANITDVSQLFCPQLNYTLGGYWDAKKVGYFYIEAYSCPEGQENPNGEPCKSDKEKQDHLGNMLYLSYFFQKTIVDPSDYDQGIKSNIETNYMVLDPSLAKSQILFFKEEQMKTDYGWILKDFSIATVFGITKMKYDVTSTQTLSRGNYLADVSVYFVRERDIFKREYVKIQTLAAQIGGILKFFLIIFQITISQYNHNDMIISMSEFLLKEASRDKREKKVGEGVDRKNTKNAKESIAPAVFSSVNNADSVNVINNNVSENSNNNRLALSENVAYQFNSNSRGEGNSSSLGVAAVSNLSPCIEYKHEPIDRNGVIENNNNFNNNNNSVNNSNNQILGRNHFEQRVDASIEKESKQIMKYLIENIRRSSMNTNDAVSKKPFAYLTLDSMKKSFSEFKKETSTLSFTMYSYMMKLHLTSCLDRKRVDIYRKLEQEYSYRANLEDIIQKLEHTEKYKKLFFTEEQ